MDASYRVLNCYKHNIKLLVKRTISIINYNLILLVYNLIKILLLFFLTVRRWSTYHESNL